MPELLSFLWVLNEQMLMVLQAWARHISSSSCVHVTLTLYGRRPLPSLLSSEILSTPDCVEHGENWKLTNWNDEADFLSDEDPPTLKRLDSFNICCSGEWKTFENLTFQIAHSLLHNNLSEQYLHYVERENIWDWK